MIIDLHFTENDKTIHVVNAAAITGKYNLPAMLADEKFFKITDDLYVSTHLTFGDMAQFILGGNTYDFAIPQGLWNSRSDWRDCVYLYDTGNKVWKLYNVTATFREYVRQLTDQAMHTDLSIGAL